MYSEHDEIILGAFQQIEESILLLQQWNANVKVRMIICLPLKV